MSKYDEYITRMCRTGKYIPDEARKFAISREVSKYYKNEDEQIAKDRSTYTPIGECK